MTGFSILPVQNYFFQATKGLVIIFVLFTTSSCNFINPDEPIPVYLECDTIGFQVSSSLQGTNSASVTDMWMYVDGNLLGGFELPSHIPVLAEGSHLITIRPGILVNGIKGTRGPYPYYTSWDTTINCEPGNTYSIHPQSTYLATTQFPLMEDFEQSGLVFDRAPNSDTTLNIILDANSFENHSGAIYLDVAHPYFNYRSYSFYIPTGKTVYAELNYKCDNEFDTGVLAQDGSNLIAVPVLTIRPSDVWKKIYINLSDAVASEPLASGYKFYVASTLVSPAANATIYLDNIKILH